MDPKKKIHVDEIRKVHKDLRKKFRKDPNFSKVWDVHCNDKDALARYAKSMQDLATDIWDEGCDGTHRIKWCRETCQEYFHQGGIKKHLDKDERRRLHFEKDKLSFIRGPNPLQASPESQNTTELSQHEHSDKLRLLDVGSCYDPFNEYEEFETTAVDINPANENVWKCDFIKVEVCQDVDFSKQLHTCVPENRQDTDNTIYENHTLVQNLPKHKIHLHELGRRGEAEDGPLAKCAKKSKEIMVLPSSYFHVVVFSLLLTYIPCPRVRWEMCRKAYKLLKINGLLLIITPDSSHQNKNAALMKKWKAAIEIIGFQRTEYHKDTHLHFMAFRKVPSDFLWDKRKTDSMVEGLKMDELCLNIPQDFQEYEDGEQEKEFDEDEDFVQTGIKELPCI